MEGVVKGEGESLLVVFVDMMVVMVVVGVVGVLGGVMVWLWLWW